MLEFVILVKFERLFVNFLHLVGLCLFSPAD